MTVESNVETRTYLAAGDLSADQYKFVVNAAGGVAVNTGAGGRVDGVLYQPAAAAGRAVAVAIEGRVKVRAGAGGLAVGQLVMSTNAGLGVLATGTNFVVGRCVEAAANGGIAAVELDVPGSVLALA